VPIVLKSGSLNLLEPSEPVQARNGTALAFFNITGKTAVQITKQQTNKDLQAFILDYIFYVWAG